MKSYLKVLKYEGMINLFIRLLRSFRRRLWGFILIGPKGTVGYGLEIIGKKNISFGRNVGIGNCSRIEAYTTYLNQKFNPKVSIGNNCSFGNFLHIGAIGNIFISDGVLMGSNVLIIDHVHGDSSQLEALASTLPSHRELVHKGDIFIGSNVWIADNVKIFGGSFIESGAVISANSIVKGRVTSNSIFFNNK